VIDPTPEPPPPPPPPPVDISTLTLEEWIAAGQACGGAAQEPPA
jgi:hypothetical protein